MSILCGGSDMKFRINKSSCITIREQYCGAITQSALCPGSDVTGFFLSSTQRNLINLLTTKCGRRNLKTNLKPDRHSNRNESLMESFLYFKSCKMIPSRPRWSRGNVLASRSKFRGFKHGWGRWVISGRKNPEYKSSGRDFKLEARVWDFRLVKESL